MNDPPKMMHRSTQGTRDHISDLIKSFTDNDAKDEEYLVYEAFPLNEIQSYIRYCIFENQLYAPYGEEIPEYNDILKDYMLAGHPEINNIDKIFINLLDDIYEIDNYFYSMEIYFTSNNKGVYCKIKM